MDDIINALLNLIPFGKKIEQMFPDKEISAGLSMLTLAVLSYIIALLRKLPDRYINAKAAEDLFPYFDYQKVKQSRELFIPTKFQNHPPSVEEEPGFSHQFVVKDKLIPWFIKTGFNGKKETDKFYLILADSGM